MMDLMLTLEMGMAVDYEVRRIEQLNVLVSLAKELTSIQLR